MGFGYLEFLMNCLKLSSYWENCKNKLEISLKVINTPAPRALLYSMWGNEGNEVNTKFVYWSIIHQRVLNKTEEVVRDARFSPIFCP